MRRYADPVEVRQGLVDGDGPEGPEQFLWRGRLWKVRAVLAHWIETGPWWQSAGAKAVIGSEDAAAEQGQQRGRVPLGDLISERELWRVEAGRGRPAADRQDGRPEADPGVEPDGRITGVFDLSFDWAEGRWTLVGCVD